MRSKLWILPWLPLMAILLALSLSIAVNEAPEPSPKLQTPSKGERPEVVKEAKAGYAVQGNADPEATADQREAPKLHTEQTATDKRIEKETADFTGLLALVGVIAIGVGVLQYCAANSAAKAARDSAKAADAALHVYRPFIVIQYPNVSTSGRDDIEDTPIGTPRSFSLRIQNAGIGPADIVGIFYEATVYPWGAGFPELVACNSDIGIALMYHEACLKESFA
jgi:hypothetical protein